MKITALETIQVSEYPNLLWVQLHTDSGLIGLGESFRGADAVAGQLHGLVAPYLLGKDPLQIERHSHALLNTMLGFASTGAELRAASAVDIALWDIFGQAMNQPIYQLLGGLSHDRMRVYNTCAGNNYNNRAARKREVDPSGNERPNGKYDDQVAFVSTPAELAHSLIEEGYPAMKIWPFDVFAQRRSAATSPPPICAKDWSRLKKSARRWATGSISCVSSTPCGTSRLPSKSPRRSNRSSPIGPKTRSR